VRDLIYPLAAVHALVEHDLRRVLDHDAEVARLLQLLLLRGVHGLDLHRYNDVYTQGA
jgi:hypothetical protein